MEFYLLKSGLSPVVYGVQEAAASPAYQAAAGVHILAWLRGQLRLQNPILVIQWAGGRHPILDLAISPSYGSRPDVLDEVLAVTQGGQGLKVIVKKAAAKAQKKLATRPFPGLEALVGCAPPGAEAVSKALAEGLEWELRAPPPVYELVIELRKLRAPCEEPAAKAMELTGADVLRELPPLVPITEESSREVAVRAWTAAAERNGPELPEGLARLARELEARGLPEGGYSLQLKIVRSFGIDPPEHGGVYVMLPEIRELGDVEGLSATVQGAAAALADYLGADYIFLGLRKGPMLFWGVWGDVEAEDGEVFWKGMVRELAGRPSETETEGLPPGLPYRIKLC